MAGAEQARSATTIVAGGGCPTAWGTRRPLASHSYQHAGDTMLTGGLLAQLTAKDGRKDDVEDLLRSARELAAAEEQTVAWFAPWISDHPYNDGSVRVRASQRRLSHRSVLGGERRISRVLLL